MADHTLVLRFDAPLQSWGVGARGTVKTTQTEPSLSGVVGLIANAMGRTYNDDITDLASITFATRTDRAGKTMRDFFTAGTTTGVAQRREEIIDGHRTFKDVLSSEGVIGVKHYLAGAVFTVAIHTNDTLLEQITDALNHPARPLFLGRRSCPITRDPVETVREGTVEHVLRTQPLDLDLIADPNPYTGLREWTPDVHADPTLRLVLPCTPTTPGAQPRHDLPTTFNQNNRDYLPRYVHIDHINRDTLASDNT